MLRKEQCSRSYSNYKSILDEEYIKKRKQKVGSNRVKDSIIFEDPVKFPSFFRTQNNPKEKNQTSKQGDNKSNSKDRQKNLTPMKYRTFDHDFGSSVAGESSYQSRKPLF